MCYEYKHKHYTKGTYRTANWKIYSYNRLKTNPSERDKANCGELFLYKYRNPYIALPSCSIPCLKFSFPLLCLSPSSVKTANFMPTAYLPIKNVLKYSYHLRASSSKWSSLIYDLIFQAHQRFLLNFINGQINFWWFGSISKSYFPPGCFFYFFFNSLGNARKHLKVLQGGNYDVQAFRFCYLVSCGLIFNPPSDGPCTKILV